MVGHGGELLIGFRDFLGRSIAHQPGDREGKTLALPLAQYGESALQFKDGIHSRADRAPGRTNRDDLMRIMSDTAGDGAGADLETANKGHRRWCWLVAIADREKQRVFVRVWLKVIALWLEVRRGLTGDEFSIFGDDDSNFDRRRPPAGGNGKVSGCESLGPEAIGGGGGLGRDQACPVSGDQLAADPGLSNLKIDEIIDHNKIGPVTDPE